ncbi:MAG: hypothetical protein LW855_03510 [Alphaproteobacteria bacterium]|jgi:hypothetical protein|nr:hypothetical protein [Alphaproteobacteria bacterium]
MSRTKARTFMVFVFLVLSACASIDVTKTSSSIYDATDPNTVEILKTKPDYKYEELGTLTVTGFGSDQTAKMYNSMRAKAAPLGATAVIITDEGLVPKAFGSYDRWGSAVAVRRIK